MSEGDRCAQVRERLVELRLANATGAGKEARVALRDALGSDFVSRCVADMTPQQQKCVLDARDLASATACSALH